MVLTALLFGYGVITTTFLTVMAIRSEYYRSLYQNVLWDNQSLERIRLFFKRIYLLLKLMYPVVDELNKGRGRPATDRRFQLRFLFWWKFFVPGPQQTAVNKLNGSPQLQKLLKAPVNPYTKSSLRRFLKDLGVTRFIEMMSKIVTILVKKGILDISKVVLDSFPVYSYLNMIKCLKMPRFDSEVARRFYQELSLASIVKLFPKQRGRSAPLDDKLKVWIHHYLWDVPSTSINHRLIFGDSS